MSASQFFCKLFLPAACLFTFVSTAFAQPEPIVTDRPDQTESADLVPIRHIQLEHGFGVEKSGTEKTWIHPSTLVRWGVAERFELRLLVEPTAVSAGDTSEFGFAPVEVGLKTSLLEEKGVLPSLALLAHLQISPLASDHLKGEFWASSFRFNAAHTLSDRLGLSYNLGMEWGGDSPEPSFIYTLSTSISLTEKLGCFVEVYGGFPQKTDAAEHNFDGGFTFQPRPNVQFDLYGGVGLTDEAPEYIAGVGVSYRLPN